MFKSPPLTETPPARPKVWLWFAGIAVALGLLYGAAWLGAAFWFKSQVQTRFAALTAEGYTITSPDPLLVGFPASIGLLFQGLAVTAPPQDGGWRWEAGLVRVTASVLTPREPVVDLAGTHRIAALLSPPEAASTIAVGSGEARLRLNPDLCLAAADISLRDASLTEVGSSEPSLALAQGTLSLTFPAAPGGTLHVGVSARTLTLANSTVPVMAKTIDAADLVFDLQGIIPSGPVPDALESWRAAGGALEIRSLALDWPPIKVAGNGTLALDEALQPIGAFTVKFQGFFAAVDAMVAEELVRPRDASLARIMLGLLARTPPGGGAPELSLPLTVQDRKLHAGPVMLMEMPEVTWRKDARVP